MPLVAGVDSSTSSCKVEVRDADSGELVSSGWAPHPPASPPRSEQDPHAWWAAFEAAAAQAGLAGPHRPAAISIAAQQHGLVVLGEEGEVLRPAKLWNDTESAIDSRALIALLGPETWSTACGSVPVPSFTITKLMWLRRCEPDVFRRIDSVLLPHDWLTLRLTGHRCTDRGDASGTGWWSPLHERYRFDLLDLVDPSVDWEARLPEVLAPSATAGECPATGALVAPGTGDNMAAALGLALAPGDVALSIGTSGTAFGVSDVPAADPTGTVAGFADATGRYLPLVCTLNATRVTDTVGRLLGVDDAGLAALALAAPAGAGGLTLVPYLDGERTPNRPGSRGILGGIRSDTTREQLARAAIEGVICNLLDAADHLRGSDPDGRVLVVGGGARSGAYRQVLADLLGRTILTPRAGEMVARGAALQAAAALSGRQITDMLEDWGTGPVDAVAANPEVDRGSIRERYSLAAADAGRSTCQEAGT